MGYTCSGSVWFGLVWFIYSLHPYIQIAYEYILASNFFNLASALPEDEWFVETAKAAINKLLMGGEGSDTSELDEDHIILHDDDEIHDDDELHDDDGLHDEVISDSDESPSSLSTITTSESFASAESQMLDSLSDFTDPES